MYAEFTNDLIIGNEMIDTQHKELIGKINDLLISCENNHGREETIQMLRYLADYTDYHFAAEEALQRELEYPGYTEHIKKHAEFKKNVADLQVILDRETEVSDTFKETVEEEVLNWFLYHINGFDRSVAEYKYMRDNTDRL